MGQGIGVAEKASVVILVVEGGQGVVYNDLLAVVLVQARHVKEVVNSAGEVDVEQTPTANPV